MFQLKQLIADIWTPVMSLIIEDIETLTEREISIQATTDEEMLAWVGPAADVKFIADDETEFEFPLQGTDFLTELTGVLSITVTEALSVGIYQAYLTDDQHIPGIYGAALYGMMQGGALLKNRQALSTLIRVQSLRAFLVETETEGFSGTYPVNIVIT